MLALIIDELRIANWQRTKDGAKGHNRPKPFSPLVKKAGQKKYGKTNLSNAEVIDYLDKLHRRGKYGN